MGKKKDESKRRAEREKQRREQQLAGYNVQMIRDFLDQLRWELAAMHLESLQSIENPEKLAHEQPINPEIADQLAECVEPVRARLHFQHEIFCWREHLKFVTCKRDPRGFRLGLPM